MCKSVCLYTYCRVVRVLQAHQGYQDSLEQLDSQGPVEAMVSQEPRDYQGRTEIKVTQELRDCLVGMEEMVSLVSTVTEERKEKTAQKESKD